MLPLRSLTKPQTNAPTAHVGRAVGSVAGEAQSPPGNFAQVLSGGRSAAHSQPSGTIFSGEVNQPLAALFLLPSAASGPSTSVVQQSSVLSHKHNLERLAPGGGIHRASTQAGTDVDDHAAALLRDGGDHGLISSAVAEQLRAAPEERMSADEEAGDAAAQEASQRPSRAAEGGRDSAATRNGNSPKGNRPNGDSVGSVFELAPEPCDAQLQQPVAVAAGHSKHSDGEQEQSPLTSGTLRAAAGAAIGLFSVAGMSAQRGESDPEAASSPQTNAVNKSQGKISVGVLHISPLLPGGATATSARKSLSDSSESAQAHQASQRSNLLLNRLSETQHASQTAWAVSGSLDKAMRDGEVQLHLSSQVLGRVSMRVTNTYGDLKRASVSGSTDQPRWVTVSLRCDSLAAAQSLTAELPQLKAAIQMRGLNVASITVEKDPSLVNGDEIAPQVMFAEHRPVAPAIPHGVGLEQSKREAGTSSSAEQFILVDSHESGEVGADPNHGTGVASSHDGSLIVLPARFARVDELV